MGCQEGDRSWDKGKDSGQGGVGMKSSTVGVSGLKFAHACKKGGRGCQEVGKGCREGGLSRWEGRGVGRGGQSGLAVGTAKRW